MWGKESCRQGARTWLMENEIDNSMYPSHECFSSIWTSIQCSECSCQPGRPLQVERKL